MKKIVLLCLMFITACDIYAQNRLIEVDFKIDSQNKITYYSNTILEASYRELAGQDNHGIYWSDILGAGDLSTTKVVTGKLTIVDGAEYIDMMKTKIRYYKQDGSVAILIAGRPMGAPGFCYFIPTENLKRIIVTIIGDNYPYMKCEAFN